MGGGGRDGGGVLTGVICNVDHDVLLLGLHDEVDDEDPTTASMDKAAFFQWRNLALRHYGINYRWSPLAHDARPRAFPCVPTSRVP